MTSNQNVSEKSLARWLLEEENPSVRYFTLRPPGQKRRRVRKVVKRKLRAILKHLNTIENLSSNLEIKKLCRSIETLLDEAL